MSTRFEPLPPPTRGFVIGLLILSILGWPWPLWNCVYGFSDATFLGYRSYYDYYGDYNTFAGLALAFGIITVLHGVFGLVKVTMFSLELDCKLAPLVRKKWMDAYLVIEAIFFVLTLAFGLAYTLVLGSEYYYNFIVWILMGLTLLIQLIALPLAIKVRNWAKSNHAHEEENIGDTTQAFVQTEGEHEPIASM